MLYLSKISMQYLKLTISVSHDENIDDSESECSSIRLSEMARRSISSAYAATFDNNIDNSVEQKQMTRSASTLDSKQISAILLNESSDSGAITISDSDSKCSQRKMCERYHRINRTTSPDNAIGKQLLLKLCSSQEHELFFTQRKPNPKCFDVLKDIVMLERTAVSDLKILTEDFYQILPEEALSCGKALVDLFYDLKYLQRFHNDHLSILETIVKNWENCLKNDNSERPRIGDLLLCSVHNALQYYRKFIQNSPIYLAAIDELTRINRIFADSLIRLQMRISCSCSINFLILKVIHRMVVWQSLFGRMVAALLEETNESMIISQLSSCRIAVEKVATFNAEKRSTLEGLVHFIKFVELGNDLNIVDGLCDPNRRFIRQGWLRKWTKRGFIPQVVILFNDALLLAHRSQANGFIRNAFLPLRAMIVEEGDTLHVVMDPTTCFTIKAVSRIFLLSGDCTRVRDLWFEELTKAIQNARCCRIEELPQTETFVIAEGSFNDKFTHSYRISNISESINAFGTKVFTTMPYSTLDVCWYRHASLGINAIIGAPANQMSGYLLRKFRNSAEWQKFWVVHANFALTFFRTHQEREAIAVLPIINYHISLPQLSDKIDCDNVFKVSYNTHCYFFRTDSLYALSKWYECIHESTINISPMDLIAGFSPK
ncbi:FERM, ARHGEF and pleckstrin domain-containing protein [Dirofilaria immitis]